MENKRKHSGVVAILSIVLFFGTLVAVAPADQSGLRIPEQVTGDLAWEHVSYLSEDIGVRVVGTPEEEATADYIIEQFEEMGYEVDIQPFSFERRKQTYESENIIATKPGKFDQTVIVGAHYDSVSERTCDDGNISTGAGDNASGVAVMLEAAEVLSNYKTK
jgi:acetylornithine deacetylase/succinyl-diaminopimelate desuccinylase-like protein